MPIVNALKTLSNTESTFVISPASSENNSWGVVDLFDIIPFVLNEKALEDISSAMSTSIKISNDASIQEVISYLKLGFRYILVTPTAIDKDWLIVDEPKCPKFDVISQGSILRYLLTNAINESCQLTFNDVIFKTTLVFIDENTTLADAYALMCLHSITSLPSKKIVNGFPLILSIRSFKKIEIQNPQTLKEELSGSANEFAERIYQLGGKKSVFAKKGDFVVATLQKMLADDTHQIYFIDDECCVIGVLSIIDILKQLF